MWTKTLALLGRCHLRRRPLVVLSPLLLAASGLWACGDEPLPADPILPPSAAVFEIRLSDPAGISALDSVRLALLELESWRFVAQGVTDPLGFLRLNELDAGEYVPVVFGSHAVLLSLPRPTWSLEIGDTARVELRALRIDPDEPQVAGQVVDADSGEPIAGAAVEMGTYSLAPERWGFTTQHRQITDAEGRFELREILIIRSSADGSTFVPPLLCHAPGYRGLRRPFEYRELPARSLRLELHAGSDSASLRGRVVDLEGAPLSGVPLALEWASIPEFDSKSAPVPPTRGLVLQGVTTRSEADGSYLFEGLAPGSYLVLPGYGPQDGWTRVDGSTLPEYLSRPHVRIAEGEEAQIGDIAAVASLRPLHPAPDEIVGSQPSFAWDAWPFIGGEWASGYTLIITPAGSDDPQDRIVVAPLLENSTPWPKPPGWLRPGAYRWRVDAYGGLASGYPLFESWAHFEVHEPESGVSSQNQPDSRILRSETIPPVTPSGAGASGSPDGR